LEEKITLGPSEEILPKNVEVVADDELEVEVSGFTEGEIVCPVCHLPIEKIMEEPTTEGTYVYACGDCGGGVECYIPKELVF